MTIYRIEFARAAAREWQRLDASLKSQLDKKLREIARNPHIASARLKGHPGAYRIKARSAGYRVIYKVQDNILIVFVVAIGKRERGEVFDTGLRRLQDLFGND